MVHDELQILSPKRHSKEVAELVSDAFLRAGAEVISKVKMTSEYHISDHWQK
jgi:DNA polymerase I-like protein with 3'-5' exonuclease and polymerase domains